MKVVVKRNRKCLIIINNQSGSILIMEKPNEC